MVSGALKLATVTLLTCYLAAIPAQSQAQNLEAGKSPSQIFAGACTACHKSPRGLLKTVPAGSLPGFLRQHYTTSGEMASLLSAYLASNGAADARYVGTQGKPGRDAKPDARPATGRRLTQPAEAPDSQPAASDRGPDGRKSAAKQRLSKRRKPGHEELPKAHAAKEEPSKGEAAKDDKSQSEPAKDERAVVKDEKPKSENAKDEGSKPEGAKPSGEGQGKSESTKSESGKTEAPRDKIETPKEIGSGETPAVRVADPAPAVAPAPSPSPAVSPTALSGTPEPAAGPSQSATAPAVAGSASK
jgi:hypothetical protein